MAIVTRRLPYRDGDTTLRGFLAHQDGRAVRGGLLLVHGGAGLDAHAQEQAQRYADLGFMVLACDMFGPGVAGDRARILAHLGEVQKNPRLLYRRAMAALRALQALPEVAGQATAAVGFCFGGMVVLTLARHGAGLAGVISMHGGLATVLAAEPGAVRARLLVCHGARDPHVRLADVTALIEEMDHAGADLQVIVYGDAMHGFTHANAAPGATTGVEYHELTDRRSFEAASRFLDELFPT